MNSTLNLSFTAGMGYDQRRVVMGTPRVEFLCDLCNQLLCNPTQSVCGHQFCTFCIENWLERDPRCPYDCMTINPSVHLLAPKVRLVQKMESLVLKCAYLGSGCSAQLTLAEIPTHEMNCKYALVRCEYCNVKISKRQLATHHTLCRKSPSNQKPKENDPAILNVDPAPEPTLEHSRKRSSKSHRLSSHRHETAEKSTKSDKKQQQKTDKSSERREAKHDHADRSKTKKRRSQNRDDPVHISPPKHQKQSKCSRKSVRHSSHESDIIALHKDYSILKFDNPSKQKRKSSRKADVSEFDPYFMIGLSSDSSPGETSGDSNDTLTEKMDGISYDSHPHNGYHSKHATHMKLVEEEHKKVRKSKRKRVKKVVKSEDPKTEMLDDEVEEDSVTYSYISKRTYSIQSVNSAMLNTIANPEPYSALHQNKKSIKECVSRSDIHINRTVVKREIPPQSSTGSSSDDEFGGRVTIKKEPVVKSEVYTDEESDLCPQLVPSHYNNAYIKDSPGPSSGKRAKRQAPKPPVPKIPLPKPPLPPRPKKQSPQTSSNDYKAELDSYRARLDVLSDRVLKQESSQSNSVPDFHRHHQPDYGGTDYLNTLSEKQFTNGLNGFLNDLMLRIQDKIQDGTIAFSEEEESESFDEIDEMDEEQIANSELVKPLFNTINQNRDYAKNEPMKTIGLSTAVLPTLALNMPHPSSSGLGSINTSCTTTQDSFHSIDITLPRETIGVQTEVIPTEDPGALFKHTQTDGTHRTTHSSDNANDSSDLTQTKSDVSVGCTSSEDNTKLQTHDKGVGTDDLVQDPDASVYHSLLSPGGSTSSSENKSPRRRSPHLIKSPAKGVSKSTATVYTFNSRPTRPRVVESLEPTSVDSSLSRNLKGGFTFSTDCSSYERIDGLPGVSDMSKPSSGDNLSDISTPISTLDRNTQLPDSEGGSDGTSATQREIIIEEQHVNPVENNKPSDSPERHVTWSESVQHIDPPPSKETTPRAQVTTTQDPLPVAQEQFFQEDAKIDDTGQIQVESNEVPMLAIAAAVDNQPIVGHVTADVNPFPFMNLRQVDIPRLCKRTYRSRPQTPIAGRRRTYSDLDYPKERGESTDSGSNEKILNNSINNISSSQELAPNILPNLAGAIDAGSRARNFSATSNASNSNGDQVVFNNLGDIRSLNITGSRDSLTNISSFGSTSNIDNISCSLPEISEASFEEKKHNKPYNTDLPSTTSTMQSPTSNLDDPLGNFGSNRDNYSTATLRKPMNLTNLSFKDDGVSVKDVSDNNPGPSNETGVTFEPEAIEQSKINFNGSPSGKSKRTIVDGKNVPQFSEIKELPSEEVDNKCFDQESEPGLMNDDNSLITHNDSIVAEVSEISPTTRESNCAEDEGKSEIPDDSTPADKVQDFGNKDSCVDKRGDVLGDQDDNQVDENTEMLSSEVIDTVPVSTSTGSKKGKKGKKGRKKNNDVHSLDTLPEDFPKQNNEGKANAPGKNKKGKKGKRGKTQPVCTVSYDINEEPVSSNIAPEEHSPHVSGEVESPSNEPDEAYSCGADSKTIGQVKCDDIRGNLSDVGANAPEEASLVPMPEKRSSVDSAERKIVFKARKLERRLSTGDEKPETSSICPRKRIPSCQSALWWEDRKQLKMLSPEFENRNTDAQVDELDYKLKFEPMSLSNSHINESAGASCNSFTLNDDLSVNPTDSHTLSDSLMLEINPDSGVASSNCLDLNNDEIDKNDVTLESNILVPVSQNPIEYPFIKQKRKKGKNKRDRSESDLTNQLGVGPIDQSDHSKDSESIPNSATLINGSLQNDVRENMKIEKNNGTDGSLNPVVSQSQVPDCIKQSCPVSQEINDALTTPHVDTAESSALTLDRATIKSEDLIKNEYPCVQKLPEVVTKSKKKKGKRNKKAMNRAQFDEQLLNDDCKAPLFTPQLSQFGDNLAKDPPLRDNFVVAGPIEDSEDFAHQLQKEGRPKIDQPNQLTSDDDIKEFLLSQQIDEQIKDQIYKTESSTVIPTETDSPGDEFEKPYINGKDDVPETSEVVDIPTCQHGDLSSEIDQNDNVVKPYPTVTEASNANPLVSSSLGNDCKEMNDLGEEKDLAAMVEESPIPEVDSEATEDVSPPIFPQVVAEVLEVIPAKKKKKGKKNSKNKITDLTEESICVVPTPTGKKKGKGKKGKKKRGIPATGTGNEDDDKVPSLSPKKVSDISVGEKEHATAFKEIELTPGEIFIEGQTNLSFESDKVNNTQQFSFDKEDEVSFSRPTSSKGAEDSVVILSEKAELGSIDFSSSPTSTSKKDEREDSDLQGGKKSRTPDYSPKFHQSDECKDILRRRTMSDEITVPFPSKPRRYSSLNLLPPSDLTGRSTSFAPEERFDCKETILFDTPKRKQTASFAGLKDGVYRKTGRPKTDDKGPPIKPFRQSSLPYHHDTTLIPNTKNLTITAARTRSLSENDPVINSKENKRRPENIRDWLFGKILPSRVKSPESNCKNDLLMSLPAGEVRLPSVSNDSVGDDPRANHRQKIPEESLIATDGQFKQINLPPPSINLERPTVLTLIRPSSYSGEKALFEEDEITPKPIQKTPSVNDILCSNTAYMNWLNTLSAIQDKKPGSVKNLLTVPKRPCHRKTHSEGQKIKVTFMDELSPIFEPGGKPPTPPPFASTHRVSSRPRVRSAIHASEETETSPLSDAKTPSADDVNKSWKGLCKSWILNNGGSRGKVKSSNDIRKNRSSKERRGSEIIETEITFSTEVDMPRKISQIDLSSDTKSRENSRTESVSEVSTGMISNNEFSADVDSFLDSEIDKLKDDYVPLKPTKSKKKKKSKRKPEDVSSPKFDNYDHVPNCPVVEVTPDSYEPADYPCIQSIVPSNYERVSHLFDDSVEADKDKAVDIDSTRERKGSSFKKAADSKFDETTSIRSFEFDHDYDGAQSFTVSKYLDGAIDKLKSRSVSNSSSSDGGFVNFPNQSKTKMPSHKFDQQNFGVSVDGCQGEKRGRLVGASSLAHDDYTFDDWDAFKTKTSSGFNPSFEKSPSSDILQEIKSPPRLNITSSFISFDRDPNPLKKPQRPVKPLTVVKDLDNSRDDFMEISDNSESHMICNKSHSESELSVPEKEVKMTFKKQLFPRWGRQRTRSESKSCHKEKVEKSLGDGLDVLNASEQDMIMTPKKNVQVFKLADGREIKYDMDTRKETVISNPNNVVHEVPPEIKSTSLLPVLDQLDRIQSTFDDMALCLADSSKPSGSHVRRANSLPGESSFGKLSGGKTPQTDQWGKEIDLDMKELTDLINNFCKDKGDYHNNSVEDILDKMVCSKERELNDSFDSAHSNDSFISITADETELTATSVKERSKKTLLSLLTDISKSKSTSAINSASSSSVGVGQSYRSVGNVSSLDRCEVMTDGILTAEVTAATITAEPMPIPTIVVDPPSKKTLKVKSKGLFENLKQRIYHTSSEDLTTPKLQRTRTYSDSRAYKEEKVGFFESLRSKKYHKSDAFELDENGFLSHVLKTKKYHRSSDWIGPKRKVQRGFTNALIRDPSIPQPKPTDQILIHDGPPMYHEQRPLRHICLDSDPIPQYYDDRSLPKQKLNDQRVEDKYSTLPKGRGRSISISPPEDSLWGSSQISERPDSSLRRTRFNSDCNNRPIPSRRRNYSDHTLHDIHSLPDIPGPGEVPRFRNKSSISNLSSITSPASDISTGFSDIDTLPNVPDHPLKKHMKRPDFLALGVLTDTELDEVFSSIREADDVDTKESSSKPSTMPVTSTPRRPTNLKLLNLSADRLVIDFGKESSESAPETPKLPEDASAQMKEEQAQMAKDDKESDGQRNKTLSQADLKSSFSEDAIYVQRSQIRNSYGKSSSEDKYILDSRSNDFIKADSDEKVFVSRSEIGLDYGRDEDGDIDIASTGSIDDETADNISMLHDIEARLNKLSTPEKDVQSNKDYHPLKYDDSSGSSQLSAGYQESVEEPCSPEYELLPDGNANDSVATDRDSPITFSATENIESKDSKPYYNLSYVTDVSLNDSNNDSFKAPASDLDRQGLSLNLDNSSDNPESSVQSDKIFVLRDEIHSDYGGHLSDASSYSPSIDGISQQSSPFNADANDSLSLSTEFSRNFISISKQVGGSEEFFLPYSVYDDSPDPALTSVDIRDEDYHAINEILNDGNVVDSNRGTPTIRRPSVDSSSSCVSFYSGIESDSNYNSVEEDVASEFEDEKSQFFQSMPQLFSGSVMSIGSNISSDGLYSDSEGKSERSQVNLDSTITDAVNLSSNLFQVTSLEDVQEMASNQNFDSDIIQPLYEVIEYGANGVSMFPSNSSDSENQNLTKIDGFPLNNLSETIVEVSDPTGTLDIDIAEECEPSVGDVNCKTEYSDRPSIGEDTEDNRLVVEDVNNSSDTVSLLSLSTKELYESNDDLFVVEEKIEVMQSQFDHGNVSSSAEKPITVELHDHTPDFQITIPAREEVFSPVSEYFTDVDTYYTSADDDVTSTQEEDCVDWSDENNQGCNSENHDTTTVFETDFLIEEEATSFISGSLVSMSTTECELSSQESIVANEDFGHDSVNKDHEMDLKISKLKDSMTKKEGKEGQFNASNGSNEGEEFGVNDPDDVFNNYAAESLELGEEYLSVSPSSSCISLSTTCCSEREFQLHAEEELLDSKGRCIFMNSKISLLKKYFADKQKEEGEFDINTNSDHDAKILLGEELGKCHPDLLGNKSSCSESQDELDILSMRNHLEEVSQFGSRSDVDTYYTSADDDKASVLADDCIEPISSLSELHDIGLVEEDIPSDYEEFCHLIEETEIFNDLSGPTKVNEISVLKVNMDNMASSVMTSKIQALLKFQEKQAVASDDSEPANIADECADQTYDGSHKNTAVKSELLVEDVSLSPSSSCISMSTINCSEDECQPETLFVEEELFDTTGVDVIMNLKISFLEKNIAYTKENEGKFKVGTEIDNEARTSLDCENRGEISPLDLENGSSCSETLDDICKEITQFGFRSDVDTYYTSADDDEASVLAEDCIEPFSSSSESHQFWGLKEENILSDHEEESELFEENKIFDNLFVDTELDEISVMEVEKGTVTSSSLMSLKIQALLKQQDQASDGLESTKKGKESNSQPHFKNLGLAEEDVNMSLSSSCISISTTSCSLDECQLESLHAEDEFLDTTAQNFSMNLKVELLKESLANKREDKAKFEASTGFDNEAWYNKEHGVDMEAKARRSEYQGDPEILEISIHHDILRSDKMPRFGSRSDVDTYYTSADDDKASVLAEDCIEPSSSSSELYGFGVMEEDVPSGWSGMHFDESQVMFHDSPDITDSFFTEEENREKIGFSLMDSKIETLDMSEENQKITPLTKDVSSANDSCFEEMFDDSGLIHEVDIGSSPSNSCISLSTASYTRSTELLQEIEVQQSITEFKSSHFHERVNLILQGKNVIPEPDISDAVHVYGESGGEQYIDQADTGLSYVLTDVDTYYTSADDDCTSVAAEDCVVWTNVNNEVASLIDNPVLNSAVSSDLVQEEGNCENQTLTVDEADSSLIIESAPSSEIGINDVDYQILIEEDIFSENEIPCAEFEVRIANISQLVTKVNKLLIDRELASVENKNSGTEISDVNSMDQCAEQHLESLGDSDVSSACVPLDAEEDSHCPQVRFANLGVEKSPTLDDVSILPEDSLQFGVGAVELPYEFYDNKESILGNKQDDVLSVAARSSPAENNSDVSRDEIPDIHIEDEPYTVTEYTEDPPENSSFELLEMSTVELLEVSDGQQICRTPDISTFLIDCDQVDSMVIQTDAETHYSSPDDEYASEGQFDCLTGNVSAEETSPTYDNDGKITTVCLPDLGSIALNLSQSNVKVIPSPDSGLTPMDATDFEVTSVVASNSFLPDPNVRKDNSKDLLEDHIKSQGDHFSERVSLSLSESDSSLVMVNNSLVGDCSTEHSNESVALKVENNTTVPECYYSSANEAATSDSLTAYTSFENLPRERLVCLVTEDSLTKVSDLSERQSEESPSSLNIDSDVGFIQQSSIDVSSPQPIEAKRVKKFRKKRKSSQNCPTGSSTSQDEHSDYVFIERPRPQTHKRAFAAAAAVEPADVATVTCEVKNDYESPTKSKKDLKDVDTKPEIEALEVPTSPCKDIIELNLSLEQNSFEQLRCVPEDTPVSVRRDSEAGGHAGPERKVDSDESTSSTKRTTIPQKDVEQGLGLCCPTLAKKSSEEPRLTEESELEFLSVLHGLKPIPKSEFFEVKRTVSPIKKKPSRRHMQSWARHLLSKTSSSEVVSSDTADDTELSLSGNNFVALNPVETVVATPVESLLLSPISSPYGTLNRPRILSGSKTRSSLSNSRTDKGTEKKVDDEIEGIYFDGRSSSCRAKKINASGLSSVLFNDKSTLSDVDEDMDKFEEELCRENFKLVMKELMFAVRMFGTADSQGSTSPLGYPQTTAEPTEPMPSTSKSNFLDLSFCDSTSDDVSRVQEAIHQQYYNQVVREIKDWSYDPDCELDGDRLMARLRIHSEPSSSEGEPPPDCISRGAAMCGSDSEVCTPQKLYGLDSHPCPDSPYQKAHSMSVMLKSRDTNKFKSKWKTCKNPECEGCQRRRKRRSDRWKNWKILNQDGNPCETN
ncbi:hypothetical protein ACHWQZ_G014394 [Mnemiopsis leidyi]